MAEQPPQPNSMSSSTVKTPQSDSSRRTRNQPNLSDCRLCQTRINPISNPLVPLLSHWRIVLLCKKCTKSVASAKTCTYCFKSVENDDNVVACSLCDCRIHSECVTFFKDTAPWCYSKVEGEGEFSVCIDCWFPKALKRANRVEKANRRVVDKGLDEGKNRKFVFKRPGRNEVSKFKRQVDGLDDKELAIRFRRVFSEFPRVERKGFCLDSRDLSAWKIRQVDGLDDKELAIRFRMVFSEFPKVERKEFSLDSRDLNLWKILYWGGVSYKRSRLGKNKEKKIVGSFSLENGGNGELLTYKRDKHRKLFKVDDDGRAICSADVSDVVVRVDGDKNGSPVDGGRDSVGLLTYKRTRFRRKGELDGMVYESGECRVFHTCKTENRQHDVEKDATCFIVGCETNEVLPNGSCSAEQDVHPLKDFKRVATVKSCVSHCHAGNLGCENQSSEFALGNLETESIFKCDDGLRLPDKSSEAGPDRYSVMYVKRVKGSTSVLKAEMKLHSDSIQHHSEAPATGQIVHQNAEPGTMSNLST